MTGTFGSAEGLFFMLERPPQLSNIVTSTLQSKTRIRNEKSASGSDKLAVVSNRDLCAKVSNARMAVAIQKRNPAEGLLVQLGLHK